MFPRLFEDLPLTNYGLLALLGLMAGLWLTVRLGKRRGLDRATILDVALWGVLWGLVGAKVTLALVHLPTYLEDPSRLLGLVRYAGVFYGGFLAGLVFLVVYAWRHGLPVLRLTDVFAPGTALAHGFGRIGCFLAGCCWGTSCELPWAVTFHSHEAWETVGTPLGRPLHPVQLYEAGVNFLLCGLLFLVFLRTRRRGLVTGLYLLLYAGARFFLEFFRGDARGQLGPLSTSQWLALAVVAGTAVLLPLLLSWGARETDVPADPTAETRAAGEDGD